MDPIAHSLAGATLAQTGLKRHTPLATAALIISANLPDIDAVVTILGPDASLYYRRGMTHGILALLILPIILTIAILAYDRLWRRRRSPDKPPVNARWLLLLSFIGVLSHLFLDWLNTYGVRLFMPFDGRWFYGDTLFIIDPWMWLLMGAAPVFAYSRRRMSRILWSGLGAGASTLVTLAPIVPLGAKLVWWIGVAAILTASAQGVDALKNQRIAVLCTVAFALYLTAMMGGNKLSEQRVQGWIAQEEDAQALELMIGPLPANPFRRDVIALTDTHYHGLTVRLFGAPSIQRLYPPQPRQSSHPAVEVALKKQEIRGFVNWMRFPLYQVEDEGDRYQVIIRDLRYVGPNDERGPGIGMAEVYVHKELTPSDGEDRVLQEVEESSRRLKEAHLPGGYARRRIALSNGDILQMQSGCGEWQGGGEGFLVRFSQDRKYPPLHIFSAGPARELTSGFLLLEERLQVGSDGHGEPPQMPDGSHSVLVDNTGSFYSTRLLALDLKTGHQKTTGWDSFGFATAGEERFVAFGVGRAEEISVDEPRRPTDDDRIARELRLWDLQTGQEQVIHDCESSITYRQRGERILVAMTCADEPEFWSVNGTTGEVESVDSEVFDRGEELPEAHQEQLQDEAIEPQSLQIGDRELTSGMCGLETYRLDDFLFVDDGVIRTE